MSCKVLLDSVEYGHKVCGMHKNVAIEVRKLIKAKDQDALKHVGNKLKQRIRDAVVGDFSIGIVFGFAFSDFLKDSKLDEDVIVVMISDPTDIDSKMMTFIRNGMNPKDKIFEALYKYDATQ
jgi:hypothetical protein